jgi:Zn-dependent protease
MTEILLSLLTKALPTLLAITLHEAAHGFVALRCGDPTAYHAGRISINPFKHIDLVGTILLPGFLLITGAPFLFGYAKPVPVDFTQLRHLRRDMILVAAAGPATNFVLAFLSALSLHALPLLPMSWHDAGQEMAFYSILINLSLAAFNMLPLLPLDGGRVLVGLLPPRFSSPIARLEPYGFPFLLLVMFLSPYLLGFFGIKGSLFSVLLTPIVKFLMNIILLGTGII